MIVIGVRFKRVGKVYYFDPCGLTVKSGQHVIVETARGIECGACAMGNTDVPESDVVSPLKKIIRIATEDDLEIMRSNEQQAHEAYQIARRKIEEHELDMRLVAVECTFDLNKILFYFTADGRVDFRSLVKDLAAIFRTRIELRQIGVRDEAKMIGGLGICGRELCCSSYLDDFQPVSINMAKEQNLSLNPTKISGTCGRLMCCLKYEHEVYTELQKVTPKTDSLVETPEGRGTVLSSQMLRGTCKVQLEDAPDEPKTFSCTDCHMIRSGRAKKGCGGCQSKSVEIDPMQEQTPSAVAEPPARPRNEKPRRVKAAPQSSEASPNVPAHSGRPDAFERPRLVKAAPKPSEEGSESAEAKKRRRRRNPAKRRPSSSEEEN
ncbi:MAG: stage 0 sporulation family protein [Butyricicoccus pullicaecorum]|nr:stage 0 sporulation family protein [Butyricicoccus pullicaecorum]